MDKSLGVQNRTLENVVLLASRLLLAWIFVHEGVFLASNFAAASSSMAKSGVPAPALVATIGLQLVCGIAILVGWYARLGAVALGLFCLATAILFHSTFANRNERLHFQKDLAIAGGIVYLNVARRRRIFRSGICQTKREIREWLAMALPALLNWRLCRRRLA